VDVQDAVRHEVYPRYLSFIPMRILTIHEYFLFIPTWLLTTVLYLLVVAVGRTEARNCRPAAGPRSPPQSCKPPAAETLSRRRAMQLAAGIGMAAS
jgi:hypothetical protein